MCNGSQFDVFLNLFKCKQKFVGSVYSTDELSLSWDSVSLGFVVYKVKKLETIQCKNCPRRVEFAKNQHVAERKCGYRVQQLNADDDYAKILAKDSSTY